MNCLSGRGLDQLRLSERALLSIYLPTGCAVCSRFLALMCCHPGEVDFDGIHTLVSHDRVSGANKDVCVFPKNFTHATEGPNPPSCSQLTLSIFPYILGNQSQVVSLVEQLFLLREVFTFTVLKTTCQFLHCVKTDKSSNTKVHSQR